MRVLTLVFLLAGLFVTSCDKDHVFDFMKSTGKIIKVDRQVTENFAEIMLEDNVNLILTQGPSYQIILEGGENLLPGIDTEIRDSVLTIRNNNKFNWVRSYDKPLNAYVTAPHFLRLGFRSTAEITCTDTIREDSIFITSHDGSGYINLIIRTHLSHISLNYGSSDVKVSGFSNNNFIHSGSYGPIHCLDLQTYNTYMTNEGTNDCYINVKNHLEYRIRGMGSIYYKGKPLSITGTSTGQGRLIALE